MKTHSLCIPSLYFLCNFSQPIFSFGCSKSNEMKENSMEVVAGWLSSLPLLTSSFARYKIYILKASKLSCISNRKSIVHTIRCVHIKFRMHSSTSMWMPLLLNRSWFMNIYFVSIYFCERVVFFLFFSILFRTSKERSTERHCTAVIWIFRELAFTFEKTCTMPYIISRFDTYNRTTYTVFRFLLIRNNNDCVVECECALVLNENDERTCIHVIRLFTANIHTQHRIASHLRKFMQ